MLPPLDEVLADAVAFAVPLRMRFRGTTVREGLLLHGPAGWGEFAPFPEYDAAESSRWLAAAIEAAWVGWPEPVRDAVPVNAIVPAVAPDVAAALANESGCATVKVKVAEPGTSLDDDVARLAAVRDAVGAHARMRVDANGAWSVEDAVASLRRLASFDLEYVEQPCATVGECALVRSRTDVPVAVDEGLRKADNPEAVESLREAADVLVVKVAPLGGVRPALDLTAHHGLPCVVSSALDTSVGLSAGLALAGALPDLPFACGLGSGLLLEQDVSADRVLPLAGSLATGHRTVEPDLSGGWAAPRTLDDWRRRAAHAHAHLSRS